MAWFPPDQREAAAELSPELTEDFADSQAYARRLEDRLRRLDRALGCRPALAPIEVGDLIAWAAAEGHDPGTGHARSVYAAELARTGRALAWPPGRNDRCWCESGQKYKRCCGSRERPKHRSSSDALTRTPDATVAQQERAHRLRVALLLDDRRSHPCELPEAPTTARPTSRVR